MTTRREARRHYKTQSFAKYHKVGGGAFVSRANPRGDLSVTDLQELEDRKATSKQDIGTDKASRLNRIKAMRLDWQRVDSEKKQERKQIKLEHRVASATVLQKFRHNKEKYQC